MNQFFRRYEEEGIQAGISENKNPRVMGKGWHDRPGLSWERLVRIHDKGYEVGMKCGKNSISAPDFDHEKMRANGLDWSREELIEKLRKAGLTKWVRLSGGPDKPMSFSLIRKWNGKKPNLSFMRHLGDDRTRGYLVLPSARAKYRWWLDGYDGIKDSIPDWHEERTEEKLKRMGLPLRRPTAEKLPKNGHPPRSPFKWESEASVSFSKDKTWYQRVKLIGDLLRGDRIYIPKFLFKTADEWEHQKKYHRRIFENIWMENDFHPRDNWMGNFREIANDMGMDNRQRHFYKDVLEYAFNREDISQKI